MNISEYKVEGKTKQELQLELRELMDFQSKVQQAQREGTISFALRDRTTGKEESVSVEEAVIEVQKRIEKIEKRLGIDNKVNHCQDCNGTDNVNIICRDCLQKAVLKVLKNTSMPLRKRS